VFITSQTKDTTKMHLYGYRNYRNHRRVHYKRVGY